MGEPSVPATARRKVLSRREIESRIGNGQLIIILGTDVLRLDSWIKFHPGGELAIKHMVGRDATDEVNALHSAKALHSMKRFRIGSVDKRWVNFVPPVQGGQFRCYDDAENENPGELGSEMISGELSPSPPSSATSDCIQDGEVSSRHRNSASTKSPSQSPSPVLRAESSPEPRFCVLDARTQQEIILDQADYPPLHGEHQHNITLKYRALHKRIENEGLYDCNYLAYAVEALRYSILFALFILCLRRSWFGFAGLFLGCFWHQLVFTAHDAGHMGITHDFQADTCIGIIVADFIGGLSLGWWKSSHNVHHIMTNSPEHDPDIELMPFFALSHRFFTSLRSTYYNRVMDYDAIAKFAVKYQHYLYYPILLFGRFNLYFLSWDHILTALGRGKSGGGGHGGLVQWHRWLELAGQIFFWTWFGYGVCYLSIPTWRDRILFILISHMVTAPLHVQITLSHYGMSTADLGVHESFAQRMLRTTMDVDCPPWLDFFHGGLQFQAIHHLYPRIPRHNLRQTQRLVREFCEDVQIPYAVFSFVDGNKKVLTKLGDIARQARILEECRRVCAASQDILAGGHHHHTGHSKAYAT
ncbi:fatty acid desaturase-domain-containing protein [Aspergillus carlsbadensis]|nr:fatty acid desaturase-domain-containing protein [Aspergillus carlsbadensis]